MFSYLLNNFIFKIFCRAGCAYIRYVFTERAPVLHILAERLQYSTYGEAKCFFQRQQRATWSMTETEALVAVQLFYAE